jgi:uncharacterized protein involved in exopolysaccharide biosynthesis
MAVPKRFAENDDEISLINISSALKKHKKLLIRMPVATAILSAGIAVALPNVYTATTRLLPPQQAQSSAAALLSQMGGVAAAAAGVGGMKNPSDLYVGMLKSRTVADRLIQRFDLKKMYDTDSQEKARTVLEKNTLISATRDGFITVDVESKDQKLVAALANGYVSELMQLTKVIALTEAGQRRVFYERQLQQAKDNLAKVEGLLKANLDRNGVISIDVESRGVLQTIGRVRAQITAKEIELNSMRAFLTADNPDYKKVEQEVRSLREELAKLENGNNAVAESNVTGAADKQRGFDNVKLMRDVKYYQMLYELLVRQYEMARMDEAKDTAVIQVLDTAVEPEDKVKPHRALIVLLSVVGALFGAAACAVGIESYRKPS